MDKAIVSLARNENIELAVIQALDQLKLPDLNNKTILLKPNVGRETDPKLGINTNPDYDPHRRAALRCAGYGRFCGRRVF